MSEKASTSAETGETEKSASAEKNAESSMAENPEKPVDSQGSRDAPGEKAGDPAPVESDAPASETVEVGPPDVGTDSATDSDVDLNADTVTQRSMGTYDTHATDLSEEAARGWHEGDLVANQYRIQRLIGQGGMGKVYLAQDEALDRAVALKRIPQEIILDVDARDDLRLEANRLLDLAHDNIIRIHTYNDGPTWPFFAMEFLEGPTLKHLLRQRKREGRTFEAEEVLVVARQVGEGLAHAHTRNVVHRDLKPANLMLAKPVEGELSPADTIKITDFGISRVVADSTLRQTGKRSGTVPYMSPEQFRGELSTQRSDIYSLACTLYELISGSPPFYTGDIAYQIMHIEPAQLEGVPRTLSETILRGLSKDADDRFESVDEFVAALEGRKIPKPGKKDRRVLRLTLMAAAGFLFALALLLATRRDPGSPGESGTAGNGVDGDPLASEGGEPGSTNSQGAEAPAPVERPLVTPVEKKTRTDIFRTWLVGEIEKQLPANVGRDYGELISGEVPSIDIRLALMKNEANLDGELLQRLVFLVAPVAEEEPPASGASPPGPLKVRGALESEEDLFSFKFSALADGSYNLSAYLEDTEQGAEVSQDQPLLERRPLVIDLVPPSFEVTAREIEGLVHPQLAQKLEFTTFEENIKVGLNTAGSSDIKDAWYSLLLPDGASSEEKVLEDPSAWQGPLLSPGESRTVRVYVVDKAGNRSENTDVIFRRLKLELEQFRTVEITGNLAKVEGIFKVEGAIYPDLQFFANGERADVQWSVRTPPPPAERSDEGPAEGEDEAGAADAAAAGEPAAGEASGEETVELDPGATRTIEFETEIPLARPVNTLSVKYSWKDRTPVSFGKAGTLERVQARAPAITLRTPALDGALKPEEKDGMDDTGPNVIYTREAALTLEGDVSPVFAGLKVMLWTNNKLGTSTQEVTVDPAASGPGGRFKTIVNLVPGQETRVEVRCFYITDDDELPTMVEPLSVYCDQEEPKVKITTRESGDQLLVLAQATEELSQLRGRLGSSDGGAAERWIAVTLATPLETGEFLYTWSIPLQERAVPIHLEMTDRAGNVAERRYDYTPLPLIAEPMPEGAKVPAVGVVPKTLPAGTIILRGRFLREVGMEFVVCGSSRLEMSKTEISESCWFRFLNEKGLRGEDDRIGKRENPMILGNQPVELIAQFVEWFGEQAADGYSYSLPTVDQWLCSFTGSRTAEKAAEEIEKWFEEDGFVFQQQERYGTNKVSKIGSRPANETPTGLLDMEGNLQEIVLNPQGLHVVIGGQNQLADMERISRACQVPRKLDEDQRELLGGFTGFRLCRQPVSER